MSRPTSGVAILLALRAAFAATTGQENDTAAISEDPGFIPGTVYVHTAAHKVGVTTNQEGDLAAVTSNLLLYSLIWFGCMLAFSVLRLKFPRVYSNNVLRNDVPSRLVPSKWPWGWALASLQMQTNEVFERRGLDAAMFLEFTHLCMRILGLTGVPLIVVMMPVYYRASKRHPRPHGDDLSRIEMGQVLEDYMWLHYLVAGLVWLVVIVARRSVFNAQARFLKLRFQWLRGLPRPRATTVLLEKIPEECQDDTKLRQYFEEMFGPGSVQSASVVKRKCAELDALLELTTRWEVVKENVHAARMKLEKEGATPRTRIRSLGPRLGQSVAAIPHYEEELRSLAPMIRRARKSLWKAAGREGGGGINTSNGFVTFRRRREAEMAQKLRYTASRDEWEISVAPDPQSVRWKDLRHSYTRMLQLRELLGYGCVAGLMLGCLVIVTSITNIAKLIDLSDLGLPDTQPFWEAFAPALGFQLFISFLPTILLLIFRTFFILKDDTWAQHKLQIWYFWILVVYVILVACIGRSLSDRMRQIMESPISIVPVLAEALPNTTHFYMNYMLLQWAMHATNFLRYVNLIKYLILSAACPEEEARRMSEPEDQDYYGMGSRSARFTINMVIGMVFSTISPLIALLAFVNFALCRVQYGYLIMFAETRKPDLGGVFWVSQLEHVQFGVMIYCCLMIGMLNERSTGDIYPTVIAGAALVFTAWSYRRFHELFKWARLPLNQIHPDDGDQEVDVWNAEAYLQPELQEDPELAYYTSKSDESMENGDDGSVVLGIMRVLSSGAEVAVRQVGELMMEVGSKIDQTLLGAELCEATRTSSSPPRCAASPPWMSPKRGSEVGASENGSTESGQEGEECRTAPMLPKRSDVGASEHGFLESGREGSECHTAPPPPPLKPVAPRAPSPPRSFPDEEGESFCDDGWLDAETFPRMPPCGDDEKGGGSLCERCTSASASSCWTSESSLKGA